MEHGLVEERSDVVVVKGVDNLAAGALADDEPELAQHAQLVGDRGGPRHLARRWGVRGVRARPACAVCGASQAATVLAGDGALCKRVAMKRIARESLDDRNRVNPITRVSRAAAPLAACLSCPSQRAIVRMMSQHMRGHPRAGPLEGHVLQAQVGDFGDT